MRLRPTVLAYPHKHYDSAKGRQKHVRSSRQRQSGSGGWPWLWQPPPSSTSRTPHPPYQWCTVGLSAVHLWMKTR